MLVEYANKAEERELERLASEGRMFYSQVTENTDYRKGLINFLSADGNDLTTLFAEKFGAQDGGRKWLNSAEGKEKMAELLATEKGKKWLATNQGEGYQQMSMLDEKCQTDGETDGEDQCKKLNKAKDAARAEFGTQILGVADQDGDGDIEVVSNVDRAQSADQGWLASIKASPFTLPVLAGVAVVGALTGIWYYFWPSKEAAVVNDDKQSKDSQKVESSDSKQDQEEPGTCSIGGHNTQGACVAAGGTWTPNSPKKDSKEESNEDKPTTEKSWAKFWALGALLLMVIIGALAYLFMGEGESSDEHDIENPAPSS